MMVLYIFCIISDTCRLRQTEKREWENVLERKVSDCLPFDYQGTMQNGHFTRHLYWQALRHFRNTLRRKRPKKAWLHYTNASQQAAEKYGSL